jgi:hypothetical protein
LAFPIFGDAVLGGQSVYEVLGMFFAGVFDPKVIDY